MSVAMTFSNQMALSRTAGAGRRTPSPRAAVVARASQDRRHEEHLTFSQTAVRSMIAATAAAGLALAPAPALAADVFTYGRPQVIAAKEKLLEEAQAKAIAAMEELAAAKAKVSSSVNNAVAQVTPAPTRVEISPPTAGSVASSPVASAVSEPDTGAPSPASALGSAAASLGDLINSAVAQ